MAPLKTEAEEAERSRSGADRHNLGETLVGLAVGLALGPLTVGTVASATTPAPPYWSIENTLSPGAKTAMLDSDSCWTADSCIAVGASPAGKTLALEWDGSKWTAQRSPQTPAQGKLDSVSCSSASTCMAVGYNGTGYAKTLAEDWNGSAWDIQPTPNSASGYESYNYLKAVSCISVSTCMAVGYKGTSGRASTMLAEEWSRSKWTVQAVPAPVGSVQSWLYGVACVSAADCIAVGYYDPNFSEALTLAEEWNGSRWSIQRTPNFRGGTSSILDGVSCSSARACTAVGYRVTRYAKTLAEAWNGNRWAVETTPNPGTARSTDYLTSVSCTLASTCTAVGYYANTSTSSLTLGETWDGTAWSIKGTPNPAGAITSNLLGVSCASKACTAVGYYETRKAYAALVEGNRPSLVANSA